MFRMFIGMIVGAVSAIFAADGAATADRIMMNATSLLNQSTSHPDSLLMIMGGWGVMVVSLSFWKSRQQPVKASKYAFLLR